jgi:transposase
VDINESLREKPFGGGESLSDSKLTKSGRIMASSRRKFPRETKLSALRRLDAGASVTEVARSCQIDPNLLRRWRRDFQKAPESAFPGPGRSPEESRIAELRRQVEHNAREIEYLKERIQRVEKTAHASDAL